MLKIALRSMANGRLVCAEDAGKQPLIANRDQPGPWETFEVIVLESDQPIPPQPGPGPGPTPPPDGGYWLGIPPTESAAYVAAIKSALLAQGRDLSGPCGAWTIAQNVAWGLRVRGYGLLSKPSGNNCQGFATDIVMQNDGTGVIVDILGDGGGNNTPSWNVSGAGEVDPGRWRPTPAPAPGP